MLLFDPCLPVANPPANVSSYIPQTTNVPPSLLLSQDQLLPEHQQQAPPRASASPLPAPQSTKVVTAKPQADHILPAHSTSQEALVVPGEETASTLWSRPLSNLSPAH